MEGDDGNGADVYRTAGEPSSSSNPSVMSEEEDVRAFLRRRHLLSTQRLLPLLRDLGVSVRLVRRTGGGGGGGVWQAAAGGGGAAAEEAYANGGFGAVPASTEAAARLPETTAREAGGQGECGVCLDGFAEGERLKAMPCSHAYHESCIVRWLGVSRLCPLCRFALPAAEA
jgi:hypothetical protein